MGVFKKIKAKAKSNRGEAEEMLINQFLDTSWAAYFEQVNAMSEAEKAEVKADFDGCGMGDAMTFADEENPTAEDCLSMVKMSMADLDDEGQKAFCKAITEKYWDPYAE